MTFLSALISRRLICTCALAISAFVPATHVFAQRTTLLVKVPFAFQDGRLNFPAGRYTIQAANEHTLVLRNSVGDQIGVIMTIGEQRAEAPRSAKVIFHKYGDQYFLSDVWLANSTIGHQLVVSRAEKALRGTPAKRLAPDNQVALNVSQP